MAQYEDEGVSEEEISLPEKTVLMSRELSLGHNVSRGGTRISTSLANQCRGPKKLSVVPGNVPRSFVDADKCCNDIRHGEILKISYGKAATFVLNALQLTL